MSERGEMMENRKPRIKLIEARGNRSRPRVAKDLGITPQGLGMIERGERVPRLPLMQRISDYYGKPIDYFFGSNGDETFPKQRSRKKKIDSA